MSATYTPGPWKLESELPATPNIDIVPRNPRDDVWGPWIATVHGRINGVVGFVSQDEAEANARLIAAAPELLAALKGIVRGPCPIVTHHRPDCEWCAAMRVIAKAEGRS